MSQTYETADVLYAVDAGVCRVTLNRPHVRNAQNRSLLAQLDAALTRAEQDEAVRVVVIDAAGEHFSAGHDLKESQQERRALTVEQRWAWEEEFYLNHCLKIWDLTKPTIAQVQGACVAAGFMVANMCDLVVAAEDAYFADPTVHSIGAASVEVLIHPWALGARKAKEMLYTGSRLSAADAYAAGMINRVVPRAELAGTVTELARRIATAPPFGVRLVKKSINRTLDIQGFRNAIQAHFDTHQLSHESAEFRRNTSQGLAASIQAGKRALDHGAAVAAPDAVGGPL